VIRFYPRFMTYFQQSVGTPNQLTGPATMGPKYGIVVAINGDTIYAQFFLDLSKGPEIFTIPKSGTTYSLLTLDVFGDVFHTNIPSQGYGTYALVPPGYTGSLPPNTIRVDVPYPTTIWIIRADSFRRLSTVRSRPLTGPPRVATTDLSPRSRRRRATHTR
jgi:hypothetical protein